MRGEQFPWRACYRFEWEHLKLLNNCETVRKSRCTHTGRNHISVSDGLYFVGIELVDEGIKAGVQIIQQIDYLDKGRTWLG